MKNPEAPTITRIIKTNITGTNTPTAMLIVSELSELKRKRERSTISHLAPVYGAGQVQTNPRAMVLVQVPRLRQ